MRTPRLAALTLSLGTLATTGCLLLSGQFVVTYALPDPWHVLLDTPDTPLTAVDVDLNTSSEYGDHKDDLKRVDDVALIGDFHNNAGSRVNIEVWLVPSAATGLSDTQVKQQGVLLWGPLAVAANGQEHVDWNRSAGLFKGRQALIAEVKGDGHFALYVRSNAVLDLWVRNGAVIAVIAAAK
jgi:hypothetical protein